jgi:DEAD/DEAH box helicase domain-containing protein
MKRIIFFDLESRKWAEDLRPDDKDAGWDELRSGKGGASAICIYDTLDDWLYAYDDHEVETVARHLEAADLVVGYCSEKFDIPCIEGLANRRLRLRGSYDIYEKIIMAYAVRGQRGQKGDFKLDTMCKRNLGRGKIDHGSNAKTLALEGKWGKLFRYCGSDVQLTRDLFRKLVTDGGLIGLRGQFISLPVPEGIQ